MKEKRIVTMPRIFAILVVVAILGATLGAGSALAAKGGIAGKPGGGGNGGKGHGGTTATLTVPSTVVAGQAFTVSGSGFSPGATVLVTVTNDWGNYVTADGSGSFSYSKTLRILGPATFEAKVQEGKNWVVKATATTTVVAP